jgi:hypothetical protein
MSIARPKSPAAPRVEHSIDPNYLDTRGELDPI